MSDLASLVELYKSDGFSPKEALEKAETERERGLEMEKIKLEQNKQSRINAGKL
jgi:hypothetical protein